MKEIWVIPGGASHSKFFAQGGTASTYLEEKDYLGIISTINTIPGSANRDVLYNGSSTMLTTIKQYVCQSSGIDLELGLHHPV